MKITIWMMAITMMLLMIAVEPVYEAVPADKVMEAVILILLFQVFNAMDEVRTTCSGNSKEKRFREELHYFFFSSIYTHVVHVKKLTLHLLLLPFFCC